MTPEQLAKVPQIEGYRFAQELVWERSARPSQRYSHGAGTRDDMIVRYRVDGILAPAQNLPSEARVVDPQRLQEPCGHGHCERRKPQDGSFSAEVEERYNGRFPGGDLRERPRRKDGDAYSRFVETDDESRDGRTTRCDAHQVGSRCATVLRNADYLRTDGAGKTSTLYACLNEIDRHTRNVITLENPVEYLIENVSKLK